ncbi:ABC transporter permease [Candidatus Lokiarchaeum ossiferum]|uniref:ABC transporter permease n=1 Tax=Candidatus Lokiarchaeum ossiferum TaxID=2951803 RepID=UPI00352D96AC
MDSFLYSYAFKDLFRQKTRTILGVMGIAVSLFLLTSVSFITDSVSYGFIDFLTADCGNQDLRLSVRHYAGEEENRSDYFDYPNITALIHEEFDEIEHFLPRTTMWGRTNGSISNPMEDERWAQLGALDVKLEEDISFGSFIDISPTLNLSEGIPVNSCLVEMEFAERFNLTEGQIFNIFLPGLNSSVNLTILSRFNSDLKFPLGRESDIVVDMSWWGETANQLYNVAYREMDWVNKTNSLVMIFKNGEDIYDIRDIENTEALITKLGADMQLLIGLDPWNIEYPKLELLYVSEMFSLGMNILFVVIGFVSMLISGILINGILSTSVEERIREYGINRVLGARKSYNIKLVVLQAMLIILIGTTLGIFGAGIFVDKVALTLLEREIPDGYASNIVFVAQPTSILMSYLIGIGVSLIVSIAPAVKVMRMSIVESINPYRHSDELYKIKKEGSANVKLIVFGFFVAANSGFVFFLLPKIMLSLKIALLASILVGTLVTFLVGVSLMAVGIMPFFLKLLVMIFEPLMQKIMNIVKITIHRHQRRNLSTIIMFILSFSFIMFATSMVEIQVNQIGGLIAYESGSDIVIRPRTYNINAPTVELQEQIMQVEGIERASSLLASTNDLENIYSEENKDFGVTMGDYIDFTSTNIWLYGIDKNFKDTISTEMQSHLVFATGNKDEAFSQIFEENQEIINIIISSSTASQLKIRKDDLARLTFTRGTEESAYICKVVGVLKNCPGLSRIREAGLFGGGTGGVIMSDINYIKCLNIPGGDDAFVDKIFVKVKEGYNHTIIEQNLETIFEEENLRIDRTSEDIEYAESEFLVIKYMFLLIQLGTIIIAIFGLLTSAYSSILERTREIGILRTLGLHGSEVENLFLVENLIILLASSTSGGIIGTIMALGLSENMTLFTQTPQMIKIPWDIVGIIYGVSILSLYLGLKLIMRKLRNKNLIEIFRETL